MVRRRVVVAAVAGFLATVGVQAFITPTTTPRVSLSALTASPSSTTEGSLEPGSKAVVLGYRGGVAELVARQLSKGGISVHGVFSSANQAGQPDLSGVKVTYTDLSQVGRDVLQEAKAVFISLDQGNGREEGPDVGKYSSLSSVVDNLPSSTSVIMSAYGSESRPVKESMLKSLFGQSNRTPRQLAEAIRSKGPRVSCTLVQHGRLFGDLPEKEPLPFATGPTDKPVVTESFAKQGVAVGVGRSLSTPDTACSKRIVVAESMVRAAQNAKNIQDFSVVSLAGPPPSAKDFDKQMARVDVSGGVVVLDKMFTEPLEPIRLQKWFTSDFATVLDNLSITRSFSPVKPTMVAKSEQGVDIIWEGVKSGSDMSIVVLGKWSVRFLEGETTPGVRVIRCDANGRLLLEPLPGEQELFFKLSESLNNVKVNNNKKKRSSKAV